jgi:glycolate oxidase iron-sulfur subunit
LSFKDLPAVKEQIMKCVRCGACRSVCPVFAVIRNETAAPRGHVFMVQMLRDGKVDPDKEVYQLLGNCLLCETCTVNCPSGIDIHELNAAARSYITDKNPSTVKNLIFDKLWTSPPLLNSTMKFMWGTQKSGLRSLAGSLGLTRFLPGDLGRAEKILSSVPFHSARYNLKEYNQALGNRKYTVGYFLGCGTDLLNPDIARATVNVLTHNGCDVIIPKNLKCCGQPHIANGKLDTARDLAIHNIELFKSLDIDYIVCDCASCSSALSLKNMEFLFSGRNKDIVEFSNKIVDLTCFLVDVLDIRLEKSHKSELPVTYHDPCHLANAQGIKNQPRELIKRIPGIKLVEMAEANRCCGGSGTYSLTHYDLSMKILDRKMDNIEKSGAHVIASCCPSCIMQLKYGVKRHQLEAEVVHPVELLNNFYK